MRWKSKKIARFLLLLLTGSVLYSCVDNDYDLSKDVDLTMGIGSDKLTLKLGDTQKIFLRDVLEVDGSEMLDTLKTGQSLYYLVKEGSTDLEVIVNKIPLFTINGVDLSPQVPLIVPGDFGGNGDVTVPPGALPAKTFQASKPIEVHITGIHPDLVRIRSLIPQPFSMHLNLGINQPSGASFVIRSIRNLKITFPNALYSTSFNPGTHVLSIEDMENLDATSVPIHVAMMDSLLLGGSQPLGALINDGRIDFSKDIQMEGEVVIAATNGFVLKENEFANLTLRVEMGEVDVNEITGIVDPEILPEFDPLDISHSLPNFLQDESVVLEISNPTIKFDLHGEGLPIPILFSSEMNSIKDGASIAKVRIPASGFVEIFPQQNSIFYFYDGPAPFDPDGVSQAAQFPIPELPSLIRRLPDTIDADFSDKKIKADPAKLHRIRLENSYYSRIDYQVLIPFRFNRNLHILYTDSIAEMNKDLKDYAASGLTLSATVENTIPLDLTLALIPVGVHGEDLSDRIKVGTAHIQAATGTSSAGRTETPVSISLDTQSPSDVSLLDKFEIKITGVSISSSELISNQYLILKDLRLKLKGQIIGNFN